MDKVNFLKLTPEANVDISIYEDALDYVFDKNNKDVKNIAISGSYGSGKTSVLETYKAKEENKKFIHISLARFNENIDAHFNKNTDVYLDAGLKGNAEKKEKENVVSELAILEGKILNQLIHQIDPINISQTDFLIKTKMHSCDILKSFIPLLIIVMTIVHLYMIDYIEKFISNLEVKHSLQWISFLTSSEMIFTSAILLVSSSIIVLWKIVKMQKQKSIFKKLNIQGNEIEIFSESKDSLFDKYLNEVIYLFKNSGVDAIVFEDIDRYEDVKIFERLREINTLINISTYKKAKLLAQVLKYTTKCFHLHSYLDQEIYNRNKPIKFFYLIRDDIFISKDRTKFFDFILPVVPVVDSSNSYDELIKFFKINNVHKQPEEIFLQEISAYIDDMRLLKNICNEYQVYINRLKALEDLSANIMFSMIVYKNIFPKDFSDLQLKKGFIYSLFIRKSELISKEKDELRRDLESTQSKLIEKRELVEREHADDIKELEAIYAMRLQALGQGTNFNHTHISKFSLNTYTDEFEIRKGIIENKDDIRISKLQQDIKCLQNKLMDIESYSLQILLKNINTNDFFKTTTSKNDLDKENKYEQVKESEYFNLLKFLVVEGHLNENYVEYMSYFSSESISAKDMGFVLSVLNRKKKVFTYELDDVNKVLERMRIVRFDQVEILNFDLLEYLLKNRKYHIELERFLAQLKNTQNIEFISLYFDTDRECELFAKNLNANWNSFFKYALNNTFTVEQLHKYSILTLYHSSKEDIQLVNVEDALTSYVSKKSNYLNIDSPKVDRLIETFKLLDISFVAIETAVSNPDLLEAVYKNDLYALNKPNVDIMIDLYYGEFSNEDKKYKNYTIVLGQKNSSLCRYVESNIVHYITLILETTNDKIDDDESTFISVLNHTDILTEQKIQYIGIQTNNIKEISVITDNSLWDEILIKSKVEYLETNILDYFLRDKKINKILIDFIQNNDKELNYANIDDGVYSKSQKQEFFVATISCVDLNNKKYKEIVQSLGFVYTDLVPQNIEHSKLMILVNERIITLTEKTLLAMRSTYPDVISDFIILNIDEYDDIMTPQIFMLDEFIKLASDESISTQIKINLLQHTTEKITIVETNYPDELKLSILKNNRADNEIPVLLSDYNLYCEEIKTFLVDLARPRINSIIDKSIKVPFDLIKALIEHDEITESSKVSIFVSLIKEFSRQEIKVLLTELGYKKILKVLNRSSNILLEVTDINKMILDAFVFVGIISNYEEIIITEIIDEEEVEVSYYKVIKTAPKKSEIPVEVS